MSPVGYMVFTCPGTGTALITQCMFTDINPARLPTIHLTNSGTIFGLQFQGTPSGQLIVRRQTSPGEFIVLDDDVSMTCEDLMALRVPYSEGWRRTVMGDLIALLAYRAHDDEVPI